MGPSSIEISPRTVSTLAIGVAGRGRGLGVVRCRLRAFANGGSRIQAGAASGTTIAAWALLNTGLFAAYLTYTPRSRDVLAARLGEIVAAVTRGRRRMRDSPLGRVLQARFSAFRRCALARSGGWPPDCARHGGWGTALEVPVSRRWGARF